jgi:flagellar hook protein FlgE
MSLFGALSSGVSGLTAQSSAMGAISDNITNVSTVGYKNTQVDFQTLVTTQTSTTFYSAGGVQSRPRQDTGMQGLLASSTSQTDIAISGAGYFIVNEANAPTINNEFLFTRAGSFFMDNEGYLRNTSGFYLQAWPVTASAVVKPNNEDLSIPNQNVISTDYLATVNLSKVGGTAAATTTIGIGANLPSNDTTGASHKTDVQFFDTLGNANSISFSYIKTARDNQWNIATNPPPGASVLTLESSSGTAYKSVGQLEFTNKPNEDSTVIIDNTTYCFSTDATIASGSTRVVTTATSTAAQDVAALIAQVIATDSDFTTTNNRILVDPGSSTNVLIKEDGTKAIAIDPTGLLTSSGQPATKQQKLFSVRQTSAGFRDYEQFKFGNVPADTDTVVINGITYEFDASGNDDTQASTALTTQARGAAQKQIDTVTLTGVYEVGDVVSVNVDAVGALTYTTIANDLTVGGDGTGGAATAAQALVHIAAKVRAVIAANVATMNKLTTATVSGAVITLTGATNNVAIATVTSATNLTAGGVTAGRTAVVTNSDIATTVANLQTAIETADPEFAAGATTVDIRQDSNSGVVDTLMLGILSKPYTITWNMATPAEIPGHPDGTTPYVSGTAFSIDKSTALIFNADGSPSAINITELEILDFENGAANMDDDADNAKQITLQLGTIGEHNGMTQFGATYVPGFISQDGSQFGTFAGVTIDTGGLVTALFDNGETRTVYQIPLATFTNVNSLGNRTGNVWNSTEASGDPTLRTADNGPAGQITQSSLEQSTVDIGEEFTKMIVVQRAFSAAAKIISTADEMLEELLRTKR